MSGPKMASYRLTPEQQRILARQRELERRKAVASEGIKRASEKIHEIGSLHQGKNAVAEELLARIGNDGGYAQKVKELCSLVSGAAPIVAATDQSRAEALEKTEKVIGERLKKAERISAEIRAIVSRNDEVLKENLASQLDRGFETSFAALRGKKDKLADEKAAFKEKLLREKGSGILPAFLLSETDAALEKLSAVQDGDYLKNFSALTLAPLLKKCETFRLEYEAVREEFEALYTEYISLCGLYYLVVQEYPCTVGSVEKLKAEIERIKHLADEDDEQTYISEALDEVMEEMGYSVIGSREVTKKTGRHFRSELYAYADGTAVNVTFSADGKIAMELGGVDSSDRLPDEKETAVLCEQMKEFCDDFKEIESRLIKKGVVLRDRISLLPPDAAYAQIINTSDYQMNGEIESLKVKRRKRNQATQKSRKAEE